MNAISQSQWPTSSSEPCCEACGHPHPVEQPCAALAPTQPPGHSARDPRPAVDSLIGTTLGNFRLTRRLGQGGMGAVYLGEHTDIGSKVAVKVLHDHLASDPGLVERFYSEARAVNLVRHDNIVAIFDIGALPSGRPYLMMEYLEGRTLSSLVGKPVDAAVAVPILMQICDGLEAAHRAMVHRDLKPENIFLVRRSGSEHFIKIADFGIARLSSRGAGGTLVGTVMGTPEYMAPEQFISGAVDRRADLYALGVIAYALATGRPPYAGGTLLALYEAHTQQAPVPPRAIAPAIPEALERIILKAMAKDPEDRYQTAAELRAALAEVAVGAPVAVPPLAAAPTAPPTPSAFSVKVAREDGTALQPRGTAHLSHGGLFILDEASPPPLFSRVRLQLSHAWGELACAGEVVRHVRPEEARAWNMSPGYAVQFVDLSSPLRTAIDRLIRGRAPDQPTPVHSREDVPNLTAEVVLTRYQAREARGIYALLGLGDDVPCDELRRRMRTAVGEMDALRKEPLSRSQRQRLERLLSRLETLGKAVSTPALRAAHDAQRGNYLGVARCLAAGLTATELEALRRGFLASRPDAQSRGHVHKVSANSLAAAGRNDQALAEYARGLAQDPLDLELHRRYWALRHTAAVQRVTAAAI